MIRTDERRTQTPIYMNAMVCNIQDTTPHLRRICLKHELLKGIGGLNPGAHIKIIIPGIKGEKAALPDLSSGRPDWYDQKNKPVSRTYTIRNLDSVNGVVDIEFVLHGDAGPASAWAAKASVDDYLGLGIKKSGRAHEWAGWYLFAGDETATPAIAAMLESLPAETAGVAFLEADSPSDIFTINTKSSVEVRWLSRDGERPEHSDKLLKAITAIEVPGVALYSRYAWIAGEHDMVKATKKYVSEQMGFDREELHATVYWTAGLSEDEGRGRR
jgi:NADPH-dependent ferric siderophore reductase